MEAVVSFADVLEAAGCLPLDDQQILVDILHRRLIQQRRDAIVVEVREAREEYRAGRVRPTPPDDIMAEIVSS